MTRDDTDIVSALREALAGRVGKDRYALWFGSSTRLELTDGELVVGAPNRFFKDWLRANFRREIENACETAMGHCPPLRFLVDSSLPEPKSDASARSAASTPEAAVEPAVLRIDAGRPANSPSDPRSTAATPPRKALGLESFVVGKSNQFARSAAEMAAERPGELSPLVIHGPTSVGKTHLLNAICQTARRVRPGVVAVYLSAEQFTSSFLEALRGSGLPSFRQKYRSVDLLVIDDLQFFCGKRYTQLELLYTVDALTRDRKQVVFAADRPPSELGELGPEMTSRLQAGVVCRIESPEYETRRGIVAQMARRMGLSIPQDVQDYIATHLTSHAREIAGALCRLEASSRAFQRPIQLAMAEEALGEMIRTTSRVVRLPDIAKAVCEAFGLDASSLQSDRKAKRISQPRMLAMWLARKYTRAALSEIGEYFGRRSHSTVVSAQKRVDGWIAGGDSVELADHVLHAEDAVRRVEQRLLAG